MRKWALFLLAVVLLSSGSLAAFGDATTSDPSTDVNQTWITPNPPTDDAYFGLLADGRGGDLTRNPQSSLLSYKSDDYIIASSKVTGVSVCKSFSVGDCPQNEWARYISAFGYCDSATDFNCVSAISAQAADGRQLKVNYLGAFPTKDAPVYKGDDSINLPDGEAAFLVDIPDAPHVGGTKYLVSTVAIGSKMPTQEKFALSGFSTSIYAVSIISGEFQIFQHSLIPSQYSLLGMIVGTGATRGCAADSKSECAVDHPLPLDIRFSLSFRNKLNIAGWLHGKVSRVESKIETLPGGVQGLTISANPVEIPLVFGWLKKSEASQSILDFYNGLTPQQIGGNGYGCLDGSSSCDALNWKSTLRGTQSTEHGINELNLWLPILQDKASQMPTYWSIRDIQLGGMDKCQIVEGGIKGVVSSNATSYVALPPTFNSETQSLDYKVAAPHFKPNGTVFKGTYDLIISSKFARCIYNFNSAPIQATVSVVTAAGVSEVATTTVTEKDGYIHLGAYGFTFSNPTIRVKLTQKASPSPSPTTAAQKKITITCVKGKVTKKITALKPVCPKGYKKK